MDAYQEYEQAARRAAAVRELIDTLTRQRMPIPAELLDELGRLDDDVMWRPVSGMRGVAE